MTVSPPCPLAFAANSAWALGNLPAWSAFRRALANPAAAQATLLQSIISRAANTAFGRAHHFDRIRSYDDFRQQVPLCDYADVEPWIERIRRGERRTLTADPVRHLATTSGTTGGRKLIPHTAGLQVEFNRAVGPWIVDLFLSRPSLLAGPAYWSISPVARQPQQDTSVVPIGFEEDSAYLGGIARHLVNAVMAVPASVRHAPTMDEWLRLTVHHLSRRRDLRLISVWHPSFLSLLLPHLPAPPRQLWPNLKVISCWTDGHASLAAQTLAAQLPGVTIQPKGLIATECIISIPFAGGWPLAIRSHFFEFLAEDGTVLRADELRQDGTYEAVVTTAGGLYRYRMHDLVRVEGFVGRTPSIRFVGKSGHVSDLFGEKLSEAFVGQTLRYLQQQTGVAWSFAMLAPDRQYYILFIEGDISPGLAAALDLSLRANPQYAYCRDLGQLLHPRVFHIAAGAAFTYAARLSSAHQRLGDVKPTALSLLPNWHQHFTGEFLAE
ncbi:MAG TPA: GH3 auxin-responsive promoter family protein [Tepidisphaeraceae bacterium]